MDNEIENSINIFFYNLHLCQHVCKLCILGFLIFWLVVKYLLTIFCDGLYEETSNFGACVNHNNSWSWNNSSNLVIDHNRIVFNLTKQVINILNKILKTISFYGCNNKCMFFGFIQESMASSPCIFVRPNLFLYEKTPNLRIPSQVLLERSR